MIVAATALFVGGCAGLGVGSKPPPPTYDLTAPKDFPRSGRAPRGQLLIPVATALGPLDSDKILVRPGVGEIAALADAQWSDRLPRIVQVRIVQAFENASRLRAVGHTGEGLAGDYELVLEIRAFEISVPAGPAAEVEIAAKIVGDRSGRIVAARIFHAAVPASATQGSAAVAALDAAFAQVATDLVLWATKII
ncbi:MAG: ABC-type transport auxiliary lipoprotein family protein [Xanthobacteraceae bacterium]